jgi:hypothetical protein
MQTFNGSRFSKESETVKTNGEAYTYRRPLQQGNREATSSLKGKASNSHTESSAPRWSGPPTSQPTGPSHSRFATTDDDTAQARDLQAQLDSERASYDLARQLQAENDASYDLVRQLQAENDATLREHRQLVQEEARFKVFDCVVCMEKFPEGDSAPVRGCGHVLCRTCMREHVQSQVDQAVWPVRCPLCVADQSRTGGHGGEYGRVPR